MDKNTENGDKECYSSLDKFALSRDILLGESTLLEKSTFQQKEANEYISNKEQEDIYISLLLTEKENQIRELRNEASFLGLLLLHNLKNEEFFWRLCLSQTDFISTLEKKKYTLEKKYFILSNSKLGSLTLKYWKIRKKLLNLIYKRR